MRVTCQKCSAAYAVDDKVVTAKGVRAQCPKCRHLQLVKKDDGASALPPSPHGELAAPPPVKKAGPAPAAKPGLDAFGSLGDPALSQSSETDFNFDFDSLGPPPPGGDAGGKEPPTVVNRPPPPARPAPAAKSAPLPMSSAPVTGGFGRVGTPPPGKPPIDMGVTGPTALSAIPEQAARDMLEFGEFDLGGNTPSQAGGGQPLGLSIPKTSMATQPSVPNPVQVVQCRSCGKPLEDPFDQALGTCEECRSQSANTAASAFVAPPPRDPPVSSSLAPSGETAAPVDDGFEPDADIPPPPPPRPSRNPVRFSHQPVRSAASFEAPPRSSRGFMVGVALTVLVVGGLVGLVVMKRPWVKKPPPLAQRVAPALSRPIDAMVAEWKKSFPDLSGSAAEHLAAGEEHLAQDSYRGYQQAEVEFQKALVLDRTSDRAIAGWALALAFGRGTDVSPAVLDATEQMLTAAAQRSGDSRVYIAHAHFLMSRGGNANDVQVMAERGKTSPSSKDKALAHLALGQAFLNKNALVAEENLNEAAKLDPKLKRISLIKARFLITQGKYKEAIGLLEERLKADPDQFEAAESLAAIYLDVGEAALAKRTLEKVRNADPRQFRPKLALAIFAYQHGGNLDGAVEQLDGLLKDKAKLAPKEVAEALLHLSTAERLGGDVDAAVDTINTALKLFPDDPALRFVQTAALISARKAAPAREALAALKGKLPEPAFEAQSLEALFEGRIAWLEGKYTEAYAVLVTSLEKDSRRTDALLLAAAAAAKANRETQAYELVLKKGLRSDPLQPAPALTMSRYYFTTAEVLLPAKGAFMGLRKDALDPNPLLAEGLLAFHLGQLAEADKIFAQVLAADVSNAAAFAFRSLIALRNSDESGALKLAQRATESERLEPQGQLALGLALWASKTTEPAYKALRLAQEQGTNLLWGRVRLAELEIRLKKPDDARRMLNSVLLVDNSYREAKRALYNAGL